MPEPVTGDRDALLRRAMAGVSVPAGARVSAAVLAVDSGRRAVYGDAAFDTASIVKVDILAALLLRAQDAGRRPAAAERAHAARMIEDSDNASAPSSESSPNTCWSSTSRSAAEGTSWALKNGWLPRSTTGLWVVNSIGRVTVDGADRLVAVLSDGTASRAEGISLVEATARAAVSAVGAG
nr:hypothetical protein [Streptomyces tricolor]